MIYCYQLQTSKNCANRKKVYKVFLWQTLESRWNGNATTFERENW